MVAGNNAVTYNHGDLVGSTMYRATFDQQGQPTATQQVTYTAFGEPVVADGGGGWHVGGELPIGMGRYGYVGGHGYESGMIALYGENEGLAAVTLVHVGERWYEPGTGRFVQRDPIGLRGGLNVYGYCGSQPMTAVDPYGLWNPLKWLYTGDGNASDHVYGEAVDGAARWLYDRCPVRGAYISLGVSHQTQPVGVYGGAYVQCTAFGSWTMDKGFGGYLGAGVGIGNSEDGSGMGGGIYVGGNETDGVTGGAYIGGKLEGAGVTGSFPGGTVLIGGGGILGGGFILDLGRL